jgi:hypothetical protein
MLPHLHIDKSRVAIETQTLMKHKLSMDRSSYLSNNLPLYLECRCNEGENCCLPNSRLIYAEVVKQDRSVGSQMHISIYAPASAQSTSTKPIKLEFHTDEKSSTEQVLK